MGRSVPSGIRCDKTAPHHIAKHHKPNILVAWNRNVLVPDLMINDLLISEKIVHILETTSTLFVDKEVDSRGG